MKFVQIMVGAAVLISAPAFANKELAQKNACLACHATDKKIVGPAYQDIAKKYAGQKDAEAMLVKSIKGGACRRQVVYSCFSRPAEMRAFFSGEFFHKAGRPFHFLDCLLITLRVLHGLDE